MKRYYTLGFILLAICVQGCIYSTKVEVRSIPEVLLIKCDSVELKFSTNGELLESLVDLYSKYKVCSARMDAIIEYNRDDLAAPSPSE